MQSISVIPLFYHWWMFPLAWQPEHSARRRKITVPVGGKITPSAVLVIQNGTTKLVNIKNQDGLTKVLDMVPDFVNKFTSKGEKDNVVEESEDDSAAKKTAAKEMEQILSDSVNKEEA